MAMDLLTISDKGLYSLRDAALYARLPIATVTRWLFGNRSGHAVLRPEGDPDLKIITFVDLLQLFAVREIRKNADRPLPLPKIRDAVRRAEDDYQIAFPLSRPHTTFLCDQDLFIKLDGHEDLVQVSGKTPHQRVKRAIVEHFLKDVHYDGDMPVGYLAFQHGEQKVSIKPGRRLGDPVVDSCGITAITLKDSYLAEGSLEAAAAAYAVSIEAVDAAYRYFDYLTGVSPA